MYHTGRGHPSHSSREYTCRTHRPWRFPTLHILLHPRIILTYSPRPQHVLISSIGSSPGLAQTFCSFPVHSCHLHVEHTWRCDPLRTPTPTLKNTYRTRTNQISHPGQAFTCTLRPAHTYQIHPCTLPSIALRILTTLSQSTSAPRTALTCRRSAEHFLHSYPARRVPSRRSRHLPLSSPF